jgi:hypothetical protein
MFSKTVALYETHIDIIGSDGVNNKNHLGHILPVSQFEIAHLSLILKVVVLLDYLNLTHFQLGYLSIGELESGLVGEQFLWDYRRVDGVLQLSMVTLFNEEQLQNQLVVDIGHDEQNVLAEINISPHTYFLTVSFFVLHSLLLHTDLLVHQKLLLVFLPSAQIPHFQNPFIALSYQEITVLRVHRFKYVQVCRFVMFVRFKLLYYLEEK